MKIKVIGFHIRQEINAYGQPATIIATITNNKLLDLCTDCFDECITIEGRVDQILRGRILAMIEDGSVTEECATCGASPDDVCEEDGAAIVQWATLLSFIAGPQLRCRRR
jgi:hypothetical protein